MYNLYIRITYIIASISLSRFADFRTRCQILLADCVRLNITINYIGSFNFNLCFILIIT